MKISLNWINDYIDIEQERKNPKELCRILTEAGLEVESVKDLSEPFRNVVVGSVLKREQHPNAERLTLCQVAVGDGVVQQIVCGATNHKEGDRVAVALPGAALANGMNIAATQIRGVESVGMLCSESELGISDGESAGILILDSSAKIGSPLARVLGLDDIVLELKVTPNRADCLSHLGLARELSTLLGKPLRSTVTFASSEDLAASDDLVGRSGGIEVHVSERAKATCLRYCGQSVKNVKVGPSPAWLRMRLMAVGVKSINNIVDVTNFVMFETGQPLHAFDSAQLTGSRIVVDLARPNEVFKTLDGTELKLTGEELTIRDQERAVALAGVVGGQNSGVTDQTNAIFVESAYFLSGPTRKTGRKHGVQTESGYRFSRGINAYQTRASLKRATELILQVAGGELSGDELDLTFETRKPSEVELIFATAQERLGFQVGADSVETHLKSIGCRVVSRTDRGIRVEVPRHRLDLAIEMDLVEEIARLEGFSKIPETLPQSQFIPTAPNIVYLKAEKLRRTLAEYGGLEARNFAFVSAVRQKAFLGTTEAIKKVGLHVEERDILLLNPIADDLNAMRKLLCFSLFQNAEHNLRRGHMAGSIFEVGVSHHKRRQSHNEEFGGTDFGEEHRVAFAIWGERLSLGEKLRGAKSPEMPVDRAVEWISRLSMQLGLGLKLENGGADAPSFLHPGQWVRITNGDKPVGFLGSLHPAIASREKLRAPLALCEIAWWECFAKADAMSGSGGGGRVTRYQPISSFPSIERDFAFLVAETASNGEVVEVVKGALGADFADQGVRIASVELFDVFHSDKLPLDAKGRKQRSVAVRLRVDSMHRTLNDEQIKTISDQVVSAAERILGAQLRA